MWEFEEDPGPGSPTRWIPLVEVPLPKPNVGRPELGTDEVMPACPVFPDDVGFTSGSNAVFLEWLTAGLGLAAVTCPVVPSIGVDVVVDSLAEFESKDTTVITVVVGVIVSESGLEGEVSVGGLTIGDGDL